MKHKDKKILYIVYHNRIPFEVYTEGAGYDFELYNNDKDHIMFSHTSSGLDSNEEVELPRLAYPKKTPTTQVWLEKGIRIKGNCQGIKILKHPILLKADEERSRNPFAISREVGDIIYCSKCGKYYDENGCIDHGIEDND